MSTATLEAFWHSRVQKRDPIARIGYALWCSHLWRLELVVARDPAYWNHRSWRYWDALARSTVVNLVAGLERGGFVGDMKQTRAKVKEVGIEVAYQHRQAVVSDIDDKVGVTAGVLSLEQVARYHRRAFRKFAIPAHFYGGTWFESIPDDVEFELYGRIYCHDCDPSNALGTAQ